MMVNKVILIGNLGHDPSLRYTLEGDPVVNFSLATNERWNDKSGQRQERTEWHDIVIFGDLAEICKQYLTKGRLVYLEGRLRTREWTTKQGDKRWKTEVVANQMRMLGSHEDEALEQTLANPQDAPEDQLDLTDDDIPF